MSGLSGSLSIALSALSVSEQALATTSNNVANANTPGYARERADLAAGDPVVYGSFTYGTGVVMQKIESLRDPILEIQLNQETQQQSKLNASLTRTATDSNSVRERQFRHRGGHQQFLQQLAAALARPLESGVAAERADRGGQPGHRLQHHREQSPHPARQSGLGSRAIGRRGKYLDQADCQCRPADQRSRECWPERRHAGGHADQPHPAAFRTDRCAGDSDRSGDHAGDSRMGRRWYLDRRVSHFPPNWAATACSTSWRGPRTFPAR